MPEWGIRLDGKETFRLDDLTPTEVQTLAAAYKCTWLDVLRSPASNLDLLADVIDLVAGKQGVEAIGRKATIGEARKLIDLLVEVDSDLPTEWSEDSDPPGADQTIST